VPEISVLPSMPAAPAASALSAPATQSQGAAGDAGSANGAEAGAPSFLSQLQSALTSLGVLSPKAPATPAPATPAMADDDKSDETAEVLPEVLLALGFVPVPVDLQAVPLMPQDGGAALTAGSPAVSALPAGLSLSSAEVLAQPATGTTSLQPGM